MLTVVTLPYPSEGLWSIGFVTGGSLKTLRRETGKNLVSVFVPTSPVPMSGYTVFVEASRLIHVPITVEEAFRTVVSAGVLIPPSGSIANASASDERNAGTPHLRGFAGRCAIDVVPEDRVRDRHRCPTRREDARTQTLSALLNLGYPRAEAERVLDDATREAGTDATLEALVRASLKRLLR